jgi:hypothetical protein
LLADTPAKLGIDYSFRRRRIAAKGQPSRPPRRPGSNGLHGCMSIKQARNLKMQNRIKRAAAICGRHGFGNIFRCGILPGVMYGVDPMPTSVHELERLDFACKKAFRWQLPIRADDLLWGLVGQQLRPST